MNADVVLTLGGYGFSVGDVAFLIAATVALVCTVMTITSLNPVHALLYLIVSLLAIAVLFFLFGAPFAALLEVIVYAGAILVLFVFVIMMLNLGQATVAQERGWLSPRAWAAPMVLSLVLLGELVFLMSGGAMHPLGGEVGAKQVGIALYGPYLLAVELASMLLLGALVAAYHLARHE